MPTPNLQRAAGIRGIAGEIAGAAERLEEVMTRLEQASTGLERLEAIEDSRWLAAGDVPASGGPSAATASAFDEMLARRDQVRRSMPSPAPGEPWTLALETLVASQIGPLDGQLYELALQLARRPANSGRDVHSKLLAIREFAEENSDDIIHMLALSLVEDLLQKPA